MKDSKVLMLSVFAVGLIAQAFIIRGIYSHPKAAPLAAPSTLTCTYDEPGKFSEVCRPTPPSFTLKLRNSQDGKVLGETYITHCGKYLDDKRNIIADPKAVMERCLNNHDFDGVLFDGIGNVYWLSRTKATAKVEEQ